MREIKFRAWWVSPNYNPKGGMYFVGSILNAIKQDGEPEHNDWGCPKQIGLMSDINNSKIGLNHANECILMQYTGLKDKNGKEVYEGDIVLCERDERCPHEVIWAEDNGGTFFGGMPGFNLSGLKRNCGSGYAWSGDEEVIGNIYENPELLQ